MRQAIYQSTILLFLLLAAGSIRAQTQKGTLVRGTPVASEITSGERHRYTIDLKEEQFALVRLMQEGIDLQVITYDAAGKKIGQFDSQNWRNGPELATLTSDGAGSYTVEVESLEEDRSGSYKLAVQSIKPLATAPNDRVDQLFSPWDTDDSPGAAVAIVRDGNIVYQQGYGIANLEYDIPITPTSVFHIASVSKQFTVFAALLLEQQGKLSLDDDVRKYLPEVPDFGKTITLRHLASHTSGLRDQWNLLIMAGWRMDDVITKEHILRLVSNQRELNFDPGAEFIYCNTGFTLLAEVVARVSDMSFADFTEANIFAPLGMEHTLFYDDHEKIVKNRAYSYGSTAEGYRKIVLNYANVGATSLFTTVSDLSRWAMNFSDPTVGDTALINRMNAPAVLNDGSEIRVGLGQFIGKYRGLNEIQHGGSDAGYRAQLSRFPDKDLSVIVLSNLSDVNAWSMAHKVADTYLADEFDTVEEEVAEESAGETFAVDRATLATYVGEFEVQPGFVLVVEEKEGVLSARATGQPGTDLIPVSTTDFTVKDVDVKIEFVPNGDDPIKLLKVHQGGMVMEAPRVKAFDAASVELSDFAGHYHSEELATTYHLTVAGDSLVAKHSKLDDFNLVPTKEDSFNGKFWPFAQIDFVRDEDDAITGFRVSNGRIRNLYFRKMAKAKAP